MSKITINEVDYTSAGVLSSTNNVVAIPGLAGSDATSAIKDKWVLCNTLVEFNKVFGTKPTDNDVSFIMAVGVLQAGLPVLYYAVDGDVADAVAEASFWTALESKSLYDVRFITAGGYCTSAVATNLVTTAKNRGDAVALIDCEQADATEDAISEFFESIDSEYAAGFAPWGNFQTSFSEDLIALPSSYAYLVAFGNSTSPSWYATSGVTRGVVNGLVAPIAELTEAEMEALQPKDAGKAVNILYNARPYGYRVWGNRTLKAISGGLTAKHFLNVRQLCIDIKKQLYKAANYLTFEQNSDLLWLSFKNQMTPLLDRMVKGNGIKGYKLIKVATTEKATLKAKIRIIPIEAVEYFDLTVELADNLDIVTE